MFSAKTTADLTLPPASELDEELPIETKAENTTSGILNALLGKRKEPSDEASVTPPASAKRPASSAKVAAWSYASLRLEPTQFEALTKLSLEMFTLLCNKLFGDQSWQLREFCINDLASAQDKILATCLLLNGHSRATIREKMCCSEGTIYFIARQLSPLVRKYLDALKKNNKAWRLLRREYLFDPNLKLHFTPLSTEENAQKRPRVNDSLTRAMPPALKPKIVFRNDRKQGRVYFIPREEKTFENTQAIYDEVMTALQKKRPQHSNANARPKSTLFQQATIEKAPMAFEPNTLAPAKKPAPLKP